MIQLTSRSGCLVEAFSVNPGLGFAEMNALMIDLLHHTEDGNGFRFLDKQYDDLDELLRIAACAVDDGTSSSQIIDDMLHNLIVFL